MKKTKNTLIILFIVTISMPILTLYLIEDKSIQYINATTLKKINKESQTFENAIISTIYEKYKGTKYSAKTYDDFEYSIIDKTINDKHVINKNLLKLKEIETIGLIKSDFFTFIETNEQIITRTSEFHGEKLNYSKKRIFLSQDNFSESIISFEIENMTSKIIGIKLPKEYIELNNKTLENYINYLNLNSEDWVYNNDLITSQSKQLKIKVERTNNFISISLIPYYI